MNKTAIEWCDMTWNVATACFHCRDIDHETLWAGLYGSHELEVIGNMHDTAPRCCETCSRPAMPG